MATKTVLIRNMSITLWRQVRALALERGCGIADLVMEALERYLKEEK